MVGSNNRTYLLKTQGLARWLMPLALVCLFALPVRAGDATLPEIMPEKTSVYLEIDIESALKQSEAALTFVDAKLGKELAAETKALFGHLKTFLTSKSFSADLLDSIHKTRLYFVLVPKDKPEINVRTIKYPKVDTETGEVIEGEFEEHSYETKSYFDFALVLESQDKLPLNFIQAIQTAAKAQGMEVPGEKLGDGFLIETPDKKAAVGAIGKYITLSQGKPTAIWKILTEGSATSLGDNLLFKRFAKMDPAPQYKGFVNIEALIGMLKDHMKSEVEDAQKKADESGDENGMVITGMLQAQQQMFETVSRIFSLDKIHGLSFSGSTACSEKEIRQHSECILHVEEDIGKILKNLLDGGHALRPPKRANPESMLLMCRMGLGEIFKELPNQLDQQTGMIYFMIASQLQAETGVTLDDLMQALAGDIYTSINVVERTHTRTRFDRETQTQVAEEVKGPMPELSFVLGLSDGEKSAQIVTTLLSALAANQKTSRYVRATEVAGSPAYMIGAEAGDPEGKANGLDTYLAALAGPYLVLGTEKEVSALVKAAKDPATMLDKKAAALVEANPKDSLIGVVPGAFGKKLYDMAMKEADKEPADMIEEGLDDLPLDGLDPELAKAVEASLRKVADLCIKMVEKSQKLANDQYTFHGHLNGKFYQVVSDNVTTKK